MWTTTYIQGGCSCVLKDIEACQRGGSQRCPGCIICDYMLYSLFYPCKSDQYNLSSDRVKWLDKEKSNCKR